jgi:hypothetical protein
MAIILFVLLRATGAFLAAPPIIVQKMRSAPPVSVFEYPFEEASSYAPSSSSSSSSSSSLLLFGTKKDNVEEKKKKTTKSSASVPAWFESFQEKPGTLIVLPFLLIFGLDLVANIAAITRRTLEYAFTGQYTTWHF